MVIPPTGAGFNWRGAWQAGVAYALGDAVEDGGSSYTVAEAHTSTSGDQPSLNPSPTLWDLVAAEGTPLVAVESGSVWSIGYHWAGGNGLYIKGDSGDIYYYAHMQKYAPGLSTGDRVGVGNLVGFVGSTGASSINHLHLGYQPGGGPLVNPYQLMVKLCR